MGQQSSMTLSHIFSLYNMVAQLEKILLFRSLCYDRQEKHQRREKKMTIKEFIKKSRLKTWDVIIAILVLGSFLPLLFCHAKPWSRSGYVSSSLESRQQSNQSL